MTWMKLYTDILFIWSAQINWNRLVNKYADYLKFRIGLCTNALIARLSEMHLVFGRSFYKDVLIL